MFWSGPNLTGVCTTIGVAGGRASTQIPDATKKTLESLPGATPIVLQTPVQLGQLQNNRYPLLSGLAAGEQIVTSNTALLRSGMPVKIAPATAN